MSPTEWQQDWDVSRVILKRRRKFPKQNQGPCLRAVIHCHQAVWFGDPSVVWMESVTTILSQNLETS